MITEIDVKDVVCSLLQARGLDQVVGGNIYKDHRPANSMLEDVTISVLASDAEQIQTFIVNVNVYVADIKRDNEMVENGTRLRELSTAFMDALAYSGFDGFIEKMDTQRIMKVNDTDLHVINNRLEIRYNSEK